MKRRNFLAGLLAAPVGTFAAGQIEILPKILQRGDQYESNGDFHPIVWEHYDSSENTFNYLAKIEDRKYRFCASGELAEDLLACHNMQVGEPFVKWVEFNTKLPVDLRHIEVSIPHYKEKEYAVKFTIDKELEGPGKVKVYKLGEKFTMTVNSTRPGDLPYVRSWYGNRN